MNHNPSPISEAVSEFYEKHGTAFAATRGAPWGVMSLVRERVKGGEVLIDVGAGNGRLATVLPPNVRYIGLEPSASLRAASSFVLAPHPHAEMQEGALPALPVAEGAADVVACIAVFHHLSPEERHVSVQELARILRPGGTLVLTVWNLHHLPAKSWPVFLASWFRLPLVRGGNLGDTWIPWRAEGAEAQRYVHAFTKRELRQLFSGPEWEIERIEGWKQDASSPIWSATNLVAVIRRT